MRHSIRWGIVLLAVAWPLSAMSAESSAVSAAGRIELKQDDGQGLLQVTVDGQEAVAYQYGHVDLPHLYPVRSPSGSTTGSIGKPALR